MAFAQFARDHHLRHALRQREQSQQVRHGGATLTQALRGLFLREAALLHQCLDGLCFLYGIEVGALYVLDQRHLHAADGLHLAHQRRNFLQLRHSGRAPTPLTSNNSIAPPVRRHHNGLDQPDRTDGIGKLRQRVRVKTLARLILVGVDQSNVDHLDSVLIVFFLKSHVAEQCIQPAPESALFLLRHIYSPPFHFRNSPARLAYAKAPAERPS